MAVNTCEMRFNGITKIAQRLGAPPPDPRL